MHRRVPPRLQVRHLWLICYGFWPACNTGQQQINRILSVKQRDRLVYKVAQISVYKCSVLFYVLWKLTELILHTMGFYFVDPLFLLEIPGIDINFDGKVQFMINPNKFWTVYQNDDNAFMHISFICTLSKPYLFVEAKMRFTIIIVQSYQLLNAAYWPEETRILTMRTFLISRLIAQCWFIIVSKVNQWVRNVI